MKKYVRESIARFRQFSIEEKLKWLRMVVIIPALVGDYHASCYHDKF